MSPRMLAGAVGVMLAAMTVSTHVCLQEYAAPRRQDTKTTLDSRELRTEESSFLEGLHSVAQRYEIPMGIEWIREPGAETTLNLELRNVTIAQVLDQLVRTRPGYEWHLEANGIVHVFPRHLRNDPRNYLNLSLESFTVHQKQLPLASLQLHLRVQELLNPKGGAQGLGGHVPIGAGEEKELSLSLRDASVRTVLDNIVLAHGNAIWIVTFPNGLPTDTNGYFHVTFPREKARLTTTERLWLLLPLSWPDAQVWW